MAGLEGKVAIVTGTSRGVGVGISRCLLEAGATVIGSVVAQPDRTTAASAYNGRRSLAWINMGLSSCFG